MQISDLHFVSNFLQEGTSFGSRAFLTKSHSYSRATALAGTLAALQPPLDALVVSGDLSTDGSGQALDTAHRFITRAEIYDDRGLPKRLVGFGLNAAKAPLVIVPGNHDRYGRFIPFQRRQVNLERVFALPMQYPYLFAIRFDPPWPDLLFIVYDSTQTLRVRDRFTPRGFLGRIAKGMVTEADCTWLVRQCQVVKDTGNVVNPDGAQVHVDWNRLVLIVVVHHHPVVPKGEHYDQLKSMDNDRRFIEACGAAGVHIVLFGHQHQYYRLRSRDSGTYFLCCPSGTEYAAENPGFVVLDLQANSGEGSVYGWRGRGFDSQSHDQFSMVFRH